MEAQEQKELVSDQTKQPGISKDNKSGSVIITVTAHDNMYHLSWYVYLVMIHSIVG